MQAVNQNTIKDLMKSNNKNLSEDNIPEFILENIEKEKKFGALIGEIKKDLKSNPAYREFFSRYNPSSIDSFIDTYALKKTRYLTYGEMLKENEENAFLRRQMEAEERLWEIQRKKLFNIECQWRAELIKIKGIEISLDFEYWEKNIENCPFIDPISEEDFSLYYEYVLSDNFHDFELDYMWMGYNEIRETLNANEDIPPWYEYYDNRMATGSLMMLPDIRGEKEEYYLSIWRKHNSENDKKQRRPRKLQKPDPRPPLYGHDLGAIENFIKTFEEGRILEYFRLYEKELSDSNNDLEQAIAILKNAGEKVPIEFSDDWRQAVIQAARKYEQKNLAIACKKAFQQYQYRTKIGIAHEVHSSDENIQWAQDWSQQIKNNIIQARTLQGEPADLDF